MFRKIIVSVLIVILSLGCINFAYAAEVPEADVIQPMYENASSVKATLSISGSTATCKTKVVGHSDVTMVQITMTLQKKNLLWWSDVEEWSYGTASETTTYTKTATVGSGTYRVKSVCKVYVSSSSYETITVYSSEV